MTALPAATAAVHVLFSTLQSVLFCAISALFTALRETWMEAVVMALALQLFFLMGRMPRRAGPAKDLEPLPKSVLHQQDESGFAKRRRRMERDLKPGSPSQMSSPSSARSYSSSARSQRGPHVQARQLSHSEEVQQLLREVVQNGGLGGSQTLRRYSVLRERGVDLSDHLPSCSCASSLYIGLMSCAIRSAAEERQSPDVKWWIGRLLGDMKRFRFPRERELYAAVLKSLVTSRLLQEALWLHDLMVADSVAPDRAMCICLMNTAISVGEDDKAIALFKDLAQLAPPSMRSYMTILRSFTRKQDWRGAVDLLAGMKDHGLKPDALVLNTVLGLCVSGDGLREAEHLCSDWEESTDTISFNILLKGHSQRGNLAAAEAILAQMLQQGPRPNEITLNTIMDCAVRAMQVLPEAASGSSSPSTQPSHMVHISRRMWQLLDEMERLALEPDRYTCSTLIKGMHLAGCEANDIDRAVQLLRRVGKCGLQASASSTSSAHASMPNAKLLEVLFNSLLDACVSLRDLDRMLTVFQLMEEFGVAVSAVTFGTLIKAFGQAGQLQHCQEAWQKMHHAQIPATVVSYGCYIDACLRNEDLASAERVFEQMLHAGVRPNAVIYTALIRGCAQRRQAGKALAYYRQMRDRGVEGSSATFNAVLDVLAKQVTDPQQLHEVIDDMRQANLVPDAVTYSILLKATCTTGPVSRALELFRRLRSEGVQLDEVAFNTVLVACSKAELIAEAEAIFEEMCQSGMKPSNVTSSVLVKMYGRAHQPDKALEVSEVVQRLSGKKPNLHVYTCLIQAFAQNRQLARSWKIFGQMLRSGVAPDAITYGTVICGCVYQRRLEQAMCLVRHAYKRKPAHCSSLAAEEEDFFAELARWPLQQTVQLQPEVLRTLRTALRRRNLSTLEAELDEILSSCGK